MIRAGWMANGRPSGIGSAEWKPKWTASGCVIIKGSGWNTGDKEKWQLCVRGCILPLNQRVCFGWCTSLLCVCLCVCKMPRERDVKGRSRWFNVTTVLLVALKEVWNGFFHLKYKISSYVNPKPAVVTLNPSNRFGLCFFLLHLHVIELALLLEGTESELDG